MLQARRSKIIEKINKERMIKVDDLTKEFMVSLETIRRDLDFLERKGYLKRVYGGAVLEGLYGEEPIYEQRRVINFEAKKAIGLKAAELIDDGDTLFMDVGTTVLEVAKSLVKKKNLTIITNATLIAQEMITHDNCRVVLLGGELRGGEMAVSGFLADENIRMFHANKIILGVGGITLEHGVTDYHLYESRLRRLMIERSDKVLAVADFSKFGVTAMNDCCPLDKIDFLVVDATTPAKILSDYRMAGVDVVVAQ